MRTVAVLGAIALVVGLSGCSGGEAPVPSVVAPTTPPAAAPSPALTPAPLPPGPAFRDDTGRFTIIPPEGWRNDATPADGVEVIFRAPGDGFQPTLNVVVRDAPAELPGTVAGVRAELASAPGYQLAADDAAVLSDGTPAHVVEGTFPAPGSGQVVRSMQLFVVHSGRAVFVTGTAPAERWAEVRPVLEASVRSLTVRA